MSSMHSWSARSLCPSSDRTGDTTARVTVMLAYVPEVSEHGSSGQSKSRTGWMENQF